MTDTNTDAWLDWRRGGVGASEVAAAWTGRYGGAYAAVAKKLGHIQPDIPPELADRGIRWEQPIADAVHALTGLYVVGEQSWCEQAGHEHRRATTDGFLAATPETTLDDVVAVLEVKTSTEGTRPAWDYYEAQVQCQMLVTGVPLAVVAVAVIGADDQLARLTVSRIEADPDQQTMLAAEYDRLWDHVQTGQLPDPDSPSAAEAVKQATAQSDPDADTVDLADIAALVAEFGDIKQAEKAAGDRRLELEALIKHRLGAATHGRCDGWTVSYSNPSRILDDTGEEAVLLAYPELGVTVLDRTAAKETLGKQLDEFKTPTGARRLTIRRNRT